MGREMNRLLTVLVISISITACVTTSNIVPIGRDSYMITGRASGGQNAGKGIIAATERANEYCATNKKFMIVRRMDTQGAATLGSESNTLIFSCVDENDPEYIRPNIRSGANVVIEDHRIK